jgi:hypothetical protein
MLRFVFRGTRGRTGILFVNSGGRWIHVDPGGFFYGGDDDRAPGKRVIGEVRQTMRIWLRLSVRAP